MERDEREFYLELGRLWSNLSHTQTQILRRLESIDAKLRVIIQEEQLVALDLSALTADVSANTDAVASASSLLSTLAQELRDAAGDPAAVAAIAASLEQNNAALSAAVVANTPQAPTPPVEPTP